MNTISFPNLGGVEFNVTKTLLRIGPVTIYWYGVIIALSFALAIFYCMKRCARFGISSDNLIDMVLAATPAAIIGARLYYVVFNYSEFRGDFGKVFRIWEGGIAIYGAVIFGIISVIVFCRVKKLNTLNMLDLGVLGLLIGQIIGRWGNFINAEAYGKEAKDLLWGMSINGRTPVHPIFFYESLWNLIGFIIIHFLSKKRRFYGQNLLVYILWYGVGRGFIEGIRGEDTLMLFDTGIRVSQALGYLSALAAICILIYKFLFGARNEPILLLSDEEVKEFIALEKETIKEKTKKKNIKSSSAQAESENEDEIENEQDTQLTDEESAPEDAAESVPEDDAETDGEDASH